MCKLHLRPVRPAPPDLQLPVVSDHRALSLHLGSQTVLEPGFAQL